MTEPRPNLKPSISQCLLGSVERCSLRDKFLDDIGDIGTAGRIDIVVRDKLFISLVKRLSQLAPDGLKITRSNRKERLG